MPIRVGLIGLNHGSRVHLPAYQRDHRFEVVAVCARTPERAQRVALEHNVPYATTDARQLLQADLDLISIATPPSTHAGLAAAAVGLGKHVVVEIPFTATLADARVLRDLVKQRDRIGTIAYVMRFNPVLRYVNDLLNDGQIGRPQLMRFDFFSSFLVNGDPAQWVWDGARGGGILAGFASHAFDIAQWWLGPIVAFEGALTTFSRVAPLAPNRPLGDDTGIIIAHFENGAMATFNFCAVSAHPHARMELHGSDATLLIKGFGDEISLIRMEDMAPSAIFPPAMYLEETRGQTGFLGNFSVFLDRLAAAIQTGQAAPELPTFTDGYALTRLIEAARQAAREQRRVSVSA
jgi:predicted dehydrogenase